MAAHKVFLIFSSLLCTKAAIHGKIFLKKVEPAKLFCKTKIMKWWYTRLEIDIKILSVVFYWNMSEGELSFL